MNEEATAHWGLCAKDKIKCKSARCASEREGSS